MRTQEIVNKTADILIRYYGNEIQPFLDSCDEDILWIGPAEKQVIRGKQHLVDAFSQEQHELKFELHNFTVFPVPTGSGRVCVTMAFFQVDTFWPDGSMNRVNQRIEFTWTKREKEMMLRICHISNSIAYDDRDTIYPVHYEETYHGLVLYGSGSGRSERISFRGPDRSKNYLNWMSILYAETSGSHAIIHAADQDYESVETILELEKRYPHLFLRCHASYLVNPEHVKSIRRFKLKLTGGQEIPVPEKKYTAVRAELEKRILRQAEP